MYSVVGIDGQVYGPVDIETLKEWTSQGRLNAKTNIIDPLDGRVMSADVVPELRSLFFVAPPIIPDPAMPPPFVESHPGMPPSPGGAARYGDAPSPYGTGSYTPVGTTYVPMTNGGPVQQAAAIQHGVPGAPSVQVNNYIAMNNQTAVVMGSSPRNKTTAIILCVLLGGIGIHRYYLGRNGSATAMLLLAFFTGGLASCVWAFVDLILICTGGLRDAEERMLT